MKGIHLMESNTMIVESLTRWDTQQDYKTMTCKESSLYVRSISIKEITTTMTCWSSTVSKPLHKPTLSCNTTHMSTLPLIHPMRCQHLTCWSTWIKKRMVELQFMVVIGLPTMNINHYSIQ